MIWKTFCFIWIFLKIKGPATCFWNVFGAIFARKFDSKYEQNSCESFTQIMKSLLHLNLWPKAGDWWALKNCKIFCEKLQHIQNYQPLRKMDHFGFCSIRTVGWHCFTKSLKLARALCFSHFLGPRASKKSKFDHLEGHLVVYAQLKGL